MIQIVLLFEVMMANEIVGAVFEGSLDIIAETPRLT